MPSRHWLVLLLAVAACGTEPSPNAPPASACASGQVWLGGSGGSQLMNPGQTCIACHQGAGREAPIYSIAGTVYAAPNEPDGCMGEGGDTIVITDANAVAYSAPINLAGNFHLSAAL